MRRIVEPELMDDPAQARAYAVADFVDVNQGFVDRIRAGFPDLRGGRVVDIGCGPADIPIRLSRALPDVEVVAVDGAGAMLHEARSAVAKHGAAARVHLVRARLPELPFPPRSFDAIISNSLLHHLRDPRVFWREAVRVGRPGAAIVVMDLLRPDSMSQAQQIVETVACNEGPLLKRDFFASLCAALTVDEVEAQLTHYLAHLRCHVASERHWLVCGRLPQVVSHSRG